MPYIAAPPRAARHQLSSTSLRFYENSASCENLAGDAGDHGIMA
jgi:hypothetical protein